MSQLPDFPFYADLPIVLLGRELFIVVSISLLKREFPVDGYLMPYCHFFVVGGIAMDCNFLCRPSSVAVTACSLQKVCLAAHFLQPHPLDSKIADLQILTYSISHKGTFLLSLPTDHLTLITLLGNIPEVFPLESLSSTSCELR